jgi:hypothetical protein
MLSAGILLDPLAGSGPFMRLKSNLALIVLALVGLAASCGGRSGTELWESDQTLDAAVGGFGGSGGSVVDSSAGRGDSSAETGTDSSWPDTYQADLVQPDGPEPKDAGKDRKDFFDALPPLPDSGPVGECVNCIRDKCGNAVNACYNDDACVQGITCAIPKCLLGEGGLGDSGGALGMLNVPCLMDCFANNFGAMAEAVAMFQCITQTCGSDCPIPFG